MGVNVIFGLFAGLFLVASIYFLAGIRRDRNWHEDFESPAWGKFLVGAVYIAVTVLLIWALLHGHHMLAMHHLGAGRS
ncbi:MAG TPA: hypothetical protein VKH35_06430 [Thermoanaerobaculia bacterium]|nr:hypothetical protein [Thermoanaerobaculia bacterium]